MREFWLEFPDINGVLNLSGGESVPPDAAPSTDQIRFQRLSGLITLTDPSGLGFESSDSHSPNGMGYIKTSEQLNQPRFAGILNFKGGAGGKTPYTGFNDFEILANKYKTRLRYNALGTGYDAATRLDGEITKLTKTEVKAGRLPVGFEFSGLASYYLTAIKKTPAGGAITLAANTPLALEPSRGELSGYKNAFTATITINANPSANFSARIYHQGSGSPVAELNMSKVLSRNDAIVWSSDPENPRVTVNGVDQIAGHYVDLSADVFPSITGSDLLFVTDIATKVEFEFKGYRRSA